MRAAMALLLVLPGIPLAEANACAVTSHEERQAAGFAVVFDERLCSSASSGYHTEQARVTQGPPADNRSAILLLVWLEHERSGDRGGAHTIREHAQVRSGTWHAAAWYNATRSGDGYTSCTAHGNVSHPQGNFTFRAALPACVPQEALHP